MWGKLRPAERSLADGALPVGLAHHVSLKRDIGVGDIVRWTDVAVPDSEAVAVRREMQHLFARGPLWLRNRTSATDYLDRQAGDGRVGLRKPIPALR